MLASDGEALLLLRKEFPALDYIELPSYDVRYSKSAVFLKLKLIFSLPKIKKAMKAERKVVEQLIDEKKIDGIISDNRLGIYSRRVPSVFITHQLNVLSGRTSFVSSKMHQRIIRKYDACWVPDVAGPTNLSGKLGHLKNPLENVVYIGPLSRMHKMQLPKKYDVLVLLSGPEPQRTLLEVIMMEAFLGQDKKVLMVRGKVADKSNYLQKENMMLVDYMQTSELERAINESDLVISRSGYTTIMDLAALEKKAYFIPTPGQYEQKYLARQLRNQGIVPSCDQDDFTLDKLNNLTVYKGLKDVKGPDTGSMESLFRLFEGE